MTKNLFVSGMFRSGTTNFAKFINTNNKISFASDPYFHYFKIARSIFYRKKGLKFDYKAPIDDNFTTSIKKKNYKLSYNINENTD